MASESRSKGLDVETTTSALPRIDTSTKVYELCRAAPYLFLTTVGMLYAAGFLVVFSHLSSYGINYSAGKFLRTRYIHIGFLCLSITILVVGTPLVLVFIRRNRAPNQQSLVSTALGMLVLLFLFWNFEAAILGFAMLARRITEGEKPPGFASLIALLVVSIVGGSFLVLGRAGKLNGEDFGAGDRGFRHSPRQQESTRFDGIMIKLRKALFTRR